MNKKTISGNLAAYHGSTSPKDAKNPPTTPKAPNEKAPCPGKDPCHGNDHGPHAVVPQPETAPRSETVPSSGSLQMVFDQILPDLARTGIVREPLLTKTQLALHYQVSGRTIQRWVASDMPFVWVGKRQKRFQLSQVQLWLQQNHIDRFASQGIATTMIELRRRVVNIPILNGLQILQSSNARPASPLPRGEGQGEGQASKQRRAQHPKPRK
jgi:hypothetical protein